MGQGEGEEGREGKEGGREREKPAKQMFKTHKEL